MPSLPVATEAFADSLPPITEPDVPASTSATAIAIWPCPPYRPRLLPSWLHKSLVQSQFNFSVCSVHSCLLDCHHLTNLCQIQVHLWEELLHSLPLHVQLLVLVPWQMQQYCGLLGLPFMLLQFLFQASACSTSAVTSQHQTMSGVHWVCSRCHAFITISPSGLQHYYCIQVATHGSGVIFPFIFAHLLIVFSFNLHGFFTSECFFYDAFDLWILYHWYLFHSYSCMCFCIITVILLSCVIFPFIFAHLSTVFSSMIHVPFAISILYHWYLFCS